MKEQEALVPLSCGAQTKRPRGIRSSDKKPQDKTSLGMFCPWEVLSLGTFYSRDVLSWDVLSWDVFYVHLLCYSISHERETNSPSSVVIDNKLMSCYIERLKY